MPFQAFIASRLVSTLSTALHTSLIFTFFTGVRECAKNTLRGGASLPPIFLTPPHFAKNILPSPKFR